MAARTTRRRKVLLSAALHPEYRATVTTYCRHLDLELIEVPFDASGRTPVAEWQRFLDQETAAAVSGYPNFFGVLEDLAAQAQSSPGSRARAVAGGREAGLRFITGLRLGALAPSLGGTETLVLHPASTSHRQMDAAGLKAAGIGEGSIRVSVGLEHPEDLWDDFAQALAAC